MKKYTWRTYKVEKETQDTVTIYFDTKSQDMSYLPGQYLNIRIKVEGELLIRSYSLNSIPSDRYPAITVKRVDGGRVSPYIIDNAANIEDWDVEGPFGSFILDREIADRHQVVLLAGGSGISPLFSMLKSVADTKHTPLLIYSNKSPEDTIFFDQLNSLETEGTLNICYAFTAPKFVSTKMNHIPGRFSLLVLRSLVKRLVAAVNDAHFYCCGPVALMNLYKDALIGLKIPEENIHMEYFSPTAVDLDHFETDNSIKEVLVTHYEDHYGSEEIQTFECTSLIEVKPRQSLLEAMKSHDIHVASSCNNGTCGTCWAVRTAGTIHMPRKHALPPEDLAAGIILLCQSYPLTEDVCVTLQ
ncbi:hypothetical protein BWD42_04445 [Sphingobacterium sp. CZ-UAM]|uniref:flavin reductase family protein n=1 Tax=Sphingobacterium sp. CZ-UAM TaxID=1933868 RepID=UPI0009878EF4|nr:iron-sulfur cluster-binding domain-containing protein [Sphingobacterium sp. CZ-UAM]OOG19203.1 hypothetical protein BWD42_04445 [Sphingobacterium sp. CZ-UAM]